MFLLVNAAGYKPIFTTSNFNFKIENYSIEGDKKLGNLIYRKLNTLSNQIKIIRLQKHYMSIETTKRKKATVKDSVGKF